MRSPHRWIGLGAIPVAFLAATGISFAQNGDESIESDDDPSGDESVAVADGHIEEFEAFDQCLRDQGVEIPELPDLPDFDPANPPSDEELSELHDPMVEGEAFEVPDAAFEACEDLMPEIDAELEAAFEAFDQCLADQGVPMDEPSGEEADEQDIDEATLDAAFEACEDQLPDDAIFGDGVIDLDCEDDLGDEEADDDDGATEEEADADGEDEDTDGGSDTDEDADE